MKSYPLLTVGIPVFNEEKYLQNTIKSVLEHEYPNLEILISDNASTDNSYAIAAEYAEKYPYVRLIRQEKNIGATENFKFLLREAGGEYFIWLGGHDILGKGFLTAAAEAMMSDSRLSAVAPFVSQITSEGDILPENINDDFDTTDLSETESLKKILNIRFCYTIHSLIRRDVALKTPFVKTASPDVLMIFAWALLGKTKTLKGEKPYYYAREVRKENREEVYKRYKKYGLFDENTERLIKKHFFDSPESYLHFLLIEHIMADTNYSFGRKMFLTHLIKNYFSMSKFLTYNHLLKIYSSVIWKPKRFMIVLAQKIKEFTES